MSFLSIATTWTVQGSPGGGAVLEADGDVLRTPHRRQDCDGMKIRAVERVDVGVPAWWVDGDDDPCEAWLLFRVGIADETLLTRGITRLALQAASVGVRHHGVDVDLVVAGAYSGYHLTGDPDDVVPVVTDLAGALVAPSIDAADQLDQARHDLIIGSPLVGSLDGGFGASLQYGATGYGLLGFDDYGLSSVDADAVRSWTQRHLVGGNAAMAWSCRPPERWSIALPWGPRVPTPGPIPAAMPTPRFTRDGEWAGLVVRVGEDLAGSVAARMTVRRLREATGVMPRQRRTGLTPRLVAAEHPVLDGRTEVWHISCDGRPSEQASARLLFDLAWQLADDGTSRHELRGVAADLRAELADGNRIEHRALHAAVSDLLDNRQPPDHRQPDLVADLHPEAVRLAWIEALATAVWIVPVGEDVPEGTGPASDELVPMPKKGTRFDALDPADPTAVVLGEFVIADVTTPSTGTVVPFRDCEGLIDLDGGLSMVVGRNGEVIVVDQKTLVGGPELSAALHARVPPELQVHSAIPTVGSFDIR